jgi:hypothetical protein
MAKGIFGGFWGRMVANTSHTNGGIITHNGMPITTGPILATGSADETPAIAGTVDGTNRQHDGSIQQQQQHSSNAPHPHPARSYAGLCEELWLGQIFLLYLTSMTIYHYVLVPSKLFKEKIFENSSGNSTTKKEATPLKSLWMPVLSLTYEWVLLIVINCIVSMAVFPGMTADVDPSSPLLKKTGWFQLLIFFVFIAGSMLGYIVHVSTVFGQWVNDEVEGSEDKSKQDRRQEGDVRALTNAENNSETNTESQSNRESNTETPTARPRPSYRTMSWLSAMRVLFVPMFVILNRYDASFLVPEVNKYFAKKYPKLFAPHDNSVHDNSDVPTSTSGATPGATSSTAISTAINTAGSPTALPSTSSVPAISAQRLNLSALREKIKFAEKDKTNEKSTKKNTEKGAKKTKHDNNSDWKSADAEAEGEAVAAEEVAQAAEEEVANWQPYENLHTNVANAAISNFGTDETEQSVAKSIVQEENSWDHEGVDQDEQVEESDFASSLQELLPAVSPLMYSSFLQARSQEKHLANKKFQQQMQLTTDSTLSPHDSVNHESGSLLGVFSSLNPISNLNLSKHMSTVTQDDLQFADIEQKLRDLSALKELTLAFKHWEDGSENGSAGSNSGNSDDGVVGSSNGVVGGSNGSSSVESGVANSKDLVNGNQRGATHSHSNKEGFMRDTHTKQLLHSIHSKEVTKLLRENDAQRVEEALEIINLEKDLFWSAADIFSFLLVFAVGITNGSVLNECCIRIPETIRKAASKGGKGGKKNEWGVCRKMIEEKKEEQLALENAPAADDSEKKEDASQKKEADQKTKKKVRFSITGGTPEKKETAEKNDSTKVEEEKTEQKSEQKTDQKTEDNIQIAETSSNKPTEPEFDLSNPVTLQRSIELAGSLSFLTYILGQSVGVMVSLMFKEMKVVPDL